MTNPEAMEIQVDKAIHNAIMEFDPGDFESYQRCTSVLKDLEASIDAASVSPLKPSLLTRVRTQLVSMAYEIGNMEEVEHYTTLLLKSLPDDDPEFLAVVLFRVKALHRLERHDAEVEEANSLILSHTVNLKGEGLVHLLSHIIREHPGNVAWSKSVVDRLEQVVPFYIPLREEEVRLWFKGYDKELRLLRLADAIREEMRERTRRALDEHGD